MTLWVEFKSKILKAIELLREEGHDTAADLLEEAVEEDEKGGDESGAAANAA
jgi:hypothetical protein